MSAEYLRETAALMRERAEAATPGPWESLDGGDRVIAWSIEPEPPHFTEDFEYVIDEPMENADNATHIASWHPAVVLAVADWLEAEAVAIEAMTAFASVSADLVREESWTVGGAALSVGQKEDGSITMRTDTSSSALTVARAYLGGQS